MKAYQLAYDTPKFNTSTLQIQQINQLEFKSNHTRKKSKKVNQEFPVWERRTLDSGDIKKIYSATNFFENINKCDSQDYEQQKENNHRFSGLKLNGSKSLSQFHDQDVKNKSLRKFGHKYAISAFPNENLGTFKKKTQLQSLDIHISQISNNEFNTDNSKNSLISNDKRNLKIEDFELGLFRSQDNLGKIYPARHLPTGFICCIKVIQIQQAKQYQQQLIKNIKLNYFNQSKYLLQIYEIFRDNSSIIIMMEYHEEGVLSSKIRAEKGMPDKRSLLCLMHISKALKVLHKKQIAFGEINHESIVFYNGTWKLSAIHSSRFKQSGFMTKRNQKNKNQQTSLYQNIEDLCLLFYEMLSGYFPARNKKISASNKKQINLQNKKINPKIFDMFFEPFLISPQKQNMNIDTIIKTIEDIVHHFEKE